MSDPGDVDRREAALPRRELRDRDRVPGEPATSICWDSGWGLLLVTPMPPPQGNGGREDESEKTTEPWGLTEPARWGMATPRDAMTVAEAMAVDGVQGETRALEEEEEEEV